MSMDISQLRKGASPSRSVSELRRAWREKIDNVRAAWDEFEKGALELETMPFKFIVELTQNCNYRCLMCAQSWEERFKRYDPSLNMSMATFVKIADEIFAKAVFVDLRGFGESVILPHWPDVVDYLERFPFIDWHLVTNLSLPRDETWEKMARLGFQLGFSCDGATQQTFESIRIRSRFNKVMHNLGVVSNAIQRHKSGWLYFISTIQKKNIHEMRALVELAHRHGVPEVQFKIVQGDKSHAQGIRDLDPGVVQSHAEQAVDAALDLGVRVTFNDWLFTSKLDRVKVEKAAMRREAPTMALFAKPEVVDYDYWNEKNMGAVWEGIFEASAVSLRKRCFKPFSYTYVNYLAEVGTCNHMMYPEMLVMGDLKTQSMKEIWNGAAYQEFRRQLVKTVPQDDRCRWCFEHRLDD